MPAMSPGSNGNDDERGPSPDLPALPSGDPPDLAGAADALDAELRRFEQIAHATRKLSLHSQKSLERAAKTTQEAADCQGRVAETLKDLVDAIGVARERHLAVVAAHEATVAAIQARIDTASDLLRRFAALGEAARVVNELVQQLASARKQWVATAGTIAGAPEELRTLATRIDEQMSIVAESADGLAAQAKSAAMTDLARQADGVKQQIAAARNKVQLMLRAIDDKN
jgi:phage gpG-like protein